MHMAPSVLGVTREHPHIAACGKFSYGSLTTTLRLVECLLCLHRMKTINHALASRLEQKVLRKKAAQVSQHEPTVAGGVEPSGDADHEADEG